MVPTFTFQPFDRVGAQTMPLQHRHGYAAGPHRGLPTGDINRSRSHHTQQLLDGCALLRGPDPPGSSRWVSLRSFQTLVPHVRLSVLLAGVVEVISRPVCVGSLVSTGWRPYEVESAVPRRVTDPDVHMSEPSNKAKGDYLITAGDPGVGGGSPRIWLWWASDDDLVVADTTGCEWRMTEIVSSAHPLLVWYDNDVDV